MPDKKVSKYVFEFYKGNSLSAFAIYGLLKNQLTAEEKSRLFAKTNLLNMIYSESVENLESVYGNKYTEIASEMKETGKQIKKNLNVPKWVISEDCYYEVLDPKWDPVVETHYEGFMELAEIMKKKVGSIKFPNESARNFYDLTQILVQDMASGEGWRDKIDVDPLYEFAFTLYAKLSLTGGSCHIENGEIKPDITQVNDMKNLAMLSKSGLLDAAAGAILVGKKLEEHIKTGDVSRGELYDELIIQRNRMKKALSMSKEEFGVLDANGVVLNGYDEFATGARGHKFALDNLEAKIKLLEAGWPVSDLNEVSKVYRVINKIKRMYNSRLKPYQTEYETYQKDFEEEENKVANTEEEQAEKAKRKSDLLKRKDALDNKKEEIDKLKSIVDDLNNQWDEAVNENITSEADRNRILGKFLISLQVANNKYPGISGLEHVLGRVTQRLNAPLTADEKAMMASSTQELYNLVNSVDPTLVSSSSQFSKFKKELKNLWTAETRLDRNNPENVENYKEQVKKVAKLGAEYLRYKRFQLHGPKSDKHKRSDLEASRVKTVEATVNSLMRILDPADETKTILDPKNPEYLVIDVPDDKRILKDYVTPKPENEYDKLLSQYTGKGMVNGSVKDMKDAFALVVGAMARRNQKPNSPFDMKDIKKFADKSRKQLFVDLMSEKELREALTSPEHAAMVVAKQIHKEYKITPVQYSTYIEVMKTIYEKLPKDKKGSTYDRMFEKIKKLAHMPADLDGMNAEKILKEVENINVHLFSNCCSILDDNLKSDNHKLKYIHGIMNQMAEFCPNLHLLNKDYYQKINNARGVPRTRDGFDITSPKCIATDDYSLEWIEGRSDKREVDNNLIERNEAKYKYTKKDLKKDVEKEVNEAKIEAEKHRAKRGKEKSIQNRPRL